MAKLILPPRMAPTRERFTVFKERDSEIWLAIRGDYESFWNFCGAGWSPTEAIERLQKKEVTQYVEEEPIIPILPQPKD
jgi:hypothetical protein